MQCLADTLNSLDIELSFDDIVLIENQPEAINSPTFAVQSGIQMYYCSQGIRVELVNPREKNYINFDDSIHHSVFVQECRDLYSANKMHSCANFIHFAAHWNIEYMTRGLEKYDDVADSFMQALAWFSSGYRARVRKQMLMDAVRKPKPIDAIKSTKSTKQQKQTKSAKIKIKRKITSESPEPKR